MSNPASNPGYGVNALSFDDLERVIAIDGAHSGQSRRRFFEKRFAAALARPGDFVLIGVRRSGALRGFAIARLLCGEFGHEDVIAVLDVMGVALEDQALGIGHMLMEELVEIMRQKGVGSIQSQAAWVNHDLLRFFQASGFELLPRLILERSMNEPLIEETEEA